MDDQLGEDIATAWDLLEAGDIEGARAAHDRVRRRAKTAEKRRPGAGAGDRERAEVAALGAALAESDGDAEAALAGYREAHALAPEEPRFLLWAADLTLAAFDEPEAVVDLCDRALDVAEEDDDLVYAVLLKTEALLGLGGDEDEAEARELLAELDGCAIDDPQVWCRAGDLYLTLGALDHAERAYRTAIELDDGWADAHHGLGTVYHERDDHRRQSEAWQRVRALDLAAPPAPIHMSSEAFERVAEAALSEIPPRARALLANVPILVDDLPSQELVAEGTDPRLLGLFSGVPLPEKSHAAGQSPHLDAIYLFQRNLERTCRSPEELAEEIRVTVLHETAHFFGLDDDDLELIGLG